MAETVQQEDIFEIYGSSIQKPAFEGASRDYKNQQRTAYLADADLLALNELVLLQSRSRHLSRNNSIVSAAESKYVTKLGAILVKWVKPTGEDHTLMQELWDEFYANPALDGKGDGNTMQATWNHDRFQSGEALSRLVIQTKGNKSRIKLKVQHIESEYLDVAYMGDTVQTNSKYKTRYGITFENSKPYVYNFFRENYFGIWDSEDITKDRIKVSATEVLHIFERLRSNQWRGIPVAAPLLENIYSLTDLRDATVDQQTNAAAISWIIERAQGLSTNALGSVVTAGLNSPEDREKRIIFSTRGGGVQYTDPGDKFELVQSRDIGNNLLGLIQELKKEISACYDIPYYLLSGDTSGLSFAAIRGILISFRDRLEYLHHFVNLPDGLAKLTAKFQDIASLTYAVDDAVAVYQFPRNYGVDELKDTQNDILEVQAGFDTSDNKRKERHTKYENVQKSREKDKELGINGLLDVGAKGTDTSSNLTNGGQEANSNSSSN